jgi:hypothetical protein
MTPQDSGGSSAGGYDVSSAIDAAFESPAGDTGDTGGTGDVQDQPQEQPLQAQPEDTGENIELPSEDDAEIDPESIDLNGRSHYRATPAQMKSFLQARKFQQSIADIVPNVEAAQDLHQRASDMRAMEIEFSRGTPEGVNKFLNHWSQSPEGLSAVVANLPYFLATKAQNGDQQALRTLNHMEGIVHSADVSNFYEKAAKTGNPADLWKAQTQDYIHNGKYKYATVNDIPREDAAQVQRRQQQARDQQLTIRENQYIDRQWKTFDAQSLTGAKENLRQQAVDTAFKTVEKAYSADSLAALKDRAIKKVDEALNSNPEWERKHRLETEDIQTEYARALRANQQTNAGARAQALVNDYQARLTRALPGIVKPLINAQTKDMVGQNKALHQKLAAGAAKSAPGGGGRPAPQSIAPMRQGRQSAADRIEEIFSTGA